MNIVSTKLIADIREIAENNNKLYTLLSQLKPPPSFQRPLSFPRPVSLISEQNKACALKKYGN